MLTHAELTAAVLAEGHPADLTGAVRRAGDENVVLETAEWIYRFPKAGVDMDREVRLLNALHGRLPVATPYVEWVGTKTRFCAYRKITGWRFDRDIYRAAPRGRQRTLARSLAEYLAAIHRSLSPAEITAIGIPDFYSLARRADLIRLAAVPSIVRAEVAALIQTAHDIRVSGRALLHDDVCRPGIVRLPLLDIRTRSIACRCRGGIRIRHRRPCQHARIRRGGADRDRAAAHPARPADRNYQSRSELEITYEPAPLENAFREAGG